MRVGEGIETPRNFLISRTMVVKAVSTPAPVFAETSTHGHLHLLLRESKRREQEKKKKVKRRERGGRK